MKILFTFCILFLAITMNAQSIAGIWNTGEDNTKIEITEKSGVYSGNVVSSDNAEVKIGKLFLKEVKSSGGKWKGKLYAPKKKEWFDATLKVEGKKLLVTVKSGLMSKTVEWTKE